MDSNDTEVRHSALATRYSRSHSKGFSLLELLLAMAITLGVGMIVFQLFLQNEEVFRDQDLVLELQQTVRAVASTINDELRMAGQGVPAFAASQNVGTLEAAQTILTGSNATTIVFRSAIDNGIAQPQNAPPYNFSMGVPAVISVDDAGPIAGLVGLNTDRFLYVWGPFDDTWTWVRAQISVVDTLTDTIVATPTQVATNGGTIEAVPYLTLEQGLAYTIDGTNVRRGTIGDFTSLTAPVIAYETIGENFTGLTFTYYDGNGNVITPSSLATRALVRRVDFTLTADTSQPLASTGEFKTYAITMSVYPRNASLY